MLKALRNDLTAMMLRLPCTRKPALRRSDEEGWLLATDLPQLLPDDLPEEFLSQLRADGWRWEVRNGWLLLDHDLVPDACPCALSGEAAALVSVLERHPGGETEPELIRRFARASEQGEGKLDALCSNLHHELAARLRTKTPLPGGLLPYIYAAYQSARRVL